MFASAIVVAIIDGKGIIEALLEAQANWRALELFMTPEIVADWRDQIMIHGAQRYPTLKSALPFEYFVSSSLAVPALLTRRWRPFGSFFSISATRRLVSSLLAMYPGSI